MCESFLDRPVTSSRSEAFPSPSYGLPRQHHRVRNMNSRLAGLSLASLRDRDQQSEAQSLWLRAPDRKYSR